MERTAARSSRSDRGRLSRGEVGTEARLRLLEQLLATNEMEVCAQRALDWLAEEVGLQQSVCAVTDVDPRRLVAIADRGAGPNTEFSIDLDSKDDPLAGALVSTTPTWFGPGVRQPPSPFRGTGFHVIPLRSEEIPDGEHARAMLVLATGNRTLSTDVQWFIDVFGKQFDRIRSRQALAESRFGRERRLLFTIINTVTDPILLTDTEGKLIIANGRAEKLFTAPEDASEGRRRAVGLNNMLFSSALSSAAVGEHGELTGRRELVLVDPIEGSDLLFELLSSPVKDSREGTGIVSILRNITDLGQASEEIRRSYQKLQQAESDVLAERHRLDLIMDSVADPIIVTDPQGDVILMNAPAERLFNLPLAPSQEAQRVVLANDAHFSSFVSNLLFSGSDLRYRGEIGLIDPTDGRMLPVEAIAGKVLTDYGELTAVVTILHDRTEAIEKASLYAELKRASEQLEQKVQEATAELAHQNELLRRQAIELEQASALKSQFLANMSHEFRTPLNAILGYTHMLLTGVYGEMPAPHRRGLGRIDSNGRHLLTIINEILDITRIEAGRMPLHLSDFRLDELFQEVFAELDPIIQRSKLKVLAEVPKRIPIVHSDRQKVKQIVVNLLSNSLKFTHKGSIRVHGTYDPKTQQICISVADTGIGIADGDQDKVFEDFRQVDNSPTRQYGGTGLGLSIVRRLANMLQGKVSLQSRIGHGSTFTLQIPRRLRRR